MGSLQIQSFNPQASDNVACFSVKGPGNEYWILCAVDNICPDAWRQGLA